MLLLLKILAVSKPVAHGERDVRGRDAGPCHFQPNRRAMVKQTMLISRRSPLNPNTKRSAVGHGRCKQAKIELSANNDTVIRMDGDLCDASDERATRYILTSHFAS